MAAGTADREIASTQSAGPAGTVAFPLAEWKLRLPPMRPGSVSRVGLVDRLVADPACPIVAVTGPPGYGKSTLVAQWAEREPQAVAAVSLDAEDNDPSVLLAYLATALDRVEPFDVDACRTRIPPGTPPAPVVARRINAVLAGLSSPVTLLVDHAEALSNPHCRDALAEVAVHLPQGHRMAVVSRGESPLPLAILRASGRVLELDAGDLAMDADEARELVDAAGATIDDDELDGLLERTEGWPVGLYLAAVAARERAPGGVAGGGRERPRVEPAAFGGDDRTVTDYLNAELLSALPEPTVAFLTRTSVLDRLSGRLCDAVADTSRSGALLESLARENQLVVPLDRRGEWYRYHHLLGDLLRAELDRREPAAVRELHARAARWFVDEGMPEAAIAHAQAAGEVDLAADLVADNSLPAYSVGRVDTVVRWMQWFEDRGDTERYPQVAVMGAIVYALTGDTVAAAQWTAVAEAQPPAGRAPDGSTMESWRAILRAWLCRSGLAAMREDTEEALAGLVPGSYWRASALALQGVSHLLEDDADRADQLFSQAVDVGVRFGRLPAAAAALSERALLALGRHDDAEAGDLIRRAGVLVDDGYLHDYPITALYAAVATRVALRDGDVGRARTHAAHASRLRVGLTAAVPYLAVQARLELARAYLELSDAAGARLLLREVRDVVQLRPDLGTLPAAADALRDKLAAMGPGSVGVTSLTTAELRLLPLLPTHLTFREMGERLHVSRHTIKTQAMSVYRKLGVSSRSEAIERVHAVGLLDD